MKERTLTVNVKRSLADRFAQVNLSYGQVDLGLAFYPSSNLLPSGYVYVHDTAADGQESSHPSWDAQESLFCKALAHARVGVEWLGIYATLTITPEESHKLTDERLEREADQARLADETALRSIT